MHEVSLCEGVLQILEQSAASEGYRQVTAVRLTIGALACVDPQALRFAFEAVMRGTLAEGARLQIDRQPATAWCPDCASTVEVAERFERCPRCGGERLQLRGGDEMRVNDVEVV